MKRPAVFFDRDNTLIACDEYLGDPAKVVLIDGAANAVARARRLGYAAVTISNQSGVARGYFSESAVHAVNQRMDELLREASEKAIIDRHEFCPFHPEAAIAKYRCESPMRKPAPGMILSAAEALALDLPASWVIGDAPRDIEAGAAAGCRTILIVDPNLKASPAALGEKKVEADYVCSSLSEAMDFVERNTQVKDEVKTQKDEEEGKKGLNVERPTSNVERSTEETAKKEIEEVAPRTASAPLAPSPTARLEALAEQILYEMRRRHEQPHADFSVSKLLAGIVQVIVLFVLFLAYLYRAQLNDTLVILVFASVMQTMTIALLIMSRQR